MALFASTMTVRKLDVDRAAKKLRGLEAPWDGDVDERLTDRGVHDRRHTESLGTIGGGNHFAELQVVEEIFDADAFARISLGRAPDRILVLVHSGSRGLGDETLRAHTALRGAAPLEVPSDAATAYLAAHDDAARWATANRAVIAERFAERLSLDLTPLLDVCHNAVTPHEGGWLHRKGAAPHDRGAIVIPGSRGGLSYLVVPIGDGAISGHSLAHGAGRKWTRTDARERLRARFRVEDMLRTELGGTVICEDKDLLFEEAPEAYKKIDRVVADLVEVGVCQVVATLSPRLTYKTRRAAREE
jgi:release factor H-coupled RctB family protein